MRALSLSFCCAFFALLGAVAAFAADEPVPPRVEARSTNLLAVALVHGDKMSIRISRLADNAPVHDAQLNVLLRGIAHPAVAEADGSYSVQTPDLAVPGAATVAFQVALGQRREDLVGELVVADARAKPEEKNGARQLWWWVLNFAVCIGFLMLLSRRRKAASGRGAP